MPLANLLAQNQLERFKSWLEERGHEHRPVSGAYQVLQIRLKGAPQWHTLYRREANAVHYSVPWPLVPVVNEFIADKKGKR
jgi:hypothetical protein